jgi:DNA-directed RNA polymerase sigma subunit (sigma70/sigma32)
MKAWMSLINLFRLGGGNSMTDKSKLFSSTAYAMTQEEVAKALDISRNKVDSIERSAIRKLKNILVIRKKINKKDFF